tara:strand:+ start:1778 stop:2434 length:657 start_codon:yes stop_codon:yes gene_type:complete
MRKSDSNFKKRLFTSAILMFAFLLFFSFSFFLVYGLIVLGIFSIIEFLQLSKRIFKNNSIFIFLNIFFISYIFLFCSIFIIFSYNLELKFVLYILLLGCIASDIGGFIIGKLIKGPKLTSISPNKTYAGCLGSIFFAVIIISTLFYYFLGLFNYNVLLIGLVVSIFCQIGDLIFSFLKRKAKVKDTGNLLPGHGGVLDRVDGILLGVPISFLFLTLLH